MSEVGMVVVPLGCLAAAAAGLLSPRFGAPLAVAVGLGLVGAGFFPAVVLSPLCAYLVVALSLAVVRERATRRRLEASSAAARAAQTREAVLGERTRIAGDIHDVVAHSASALLVQLMAARSLLEDDPVDVPRLRAMLDRGVEVARASMHETQTVLSALRGGAPDWAQVRQLANDFAMTSGLSCEIVLPDPPPALEQDVALALYRTVQEALTNTVRHSAAERVRLEVTVQDGRVLATVEDIEGKRRQPHPKLPSGGQGLTGLRERVTAAGGTLVAGPTATGFLVRLTLPVAP
ncbi:sensor histidine kinase [Streptomyces sp. NPDC014006]|uniref:sensor histidine kinase n=1 Tax=Streptomyces sp. NPDC014006 TaxID=3364870 RepID=UPI0036FB1CE0